MALFGKKENKEEKKEDLQESSKQGVKKDKVESKKEVKKNEFAKDAFVGYGILLEPWVTEKSHEGMENDKYVFKVNMRSSKKKIKTAIEKVYDVTVEKVAVIKIHPKKKRFGRYEGRRSAFKKAVVTLKKGDSIQIFEGA